MKDRTFTQAVAARSAEDPMPGAIKASRDVAAMVAAFRAGLIDAGMTPDEAAPFVMAHYEFLKTRMEAGAQVAESVKRTALLRDPRTSGAQ